MSLIFLQYVYVPSGQNILPVLTQLKLSMGPGLISIVQILSGEGILKTLKIGWKTHCVLFHHENKV
jgi:hypothetical protein